MVVQLLHNARIFLLRFYIYITWNLWMLIECVLNRRSTWITINNLEFLDERNGLVVLNKNPDLLINHKKPWFYSLTLQMQLFYHRPQYANSKLDHMFHFVHRLDYSTSGVICIAYNRTVAGVIGKAFTKRVVSKQYLAVVWGWVEDMGEAVQDSGVYRISLALGKSTNHQQRILSAQDPSCQNARSCLTEVIILDYGHLNGHRATKLLLIPHTGRRHQLRVHCATALGHSIAGDLKYSAEHRDRQLPRMLLHAYSLCVNMRSARGRAALLSVDDGSVEFLSWKTSEAFPPTALIWSVDRCINQL